MAEQRSTTRMERRIERARDRASQLQAELDTSYPGMFRVIRIKNRVLIRRLKPAKRAQ